MLNKSCPMFVFIYDLGLDFAAMYDTFCKLLYDNYTGM